MRWKGRITPGSTSDRVTGFEDWLPTLLELVGAKDSTPAGIDGISFAPTLLGKNQPPRPFLYRESPGYGGQQCVRVGDWKLIRTRLNPGPNVKNPPPPTLELFDSSRKIPPKPPAPRRASSRRWSPGSKVYDRAAHAVEALAHRPAWVTSRSHDSLRPCPMAGLELLPRILPAPDSRSASSLPGRRSSRDPSMCLPATEPPRRRTGLGQLVGEPRRRLAAPATDRPDFVRDAARTPNYN